MLSSCNYPVGGPLYKNRLLSMAIPDLTKNMSIEITKRSPARQDPQSLPFIVALPQVQKKAEFHCHSGYTSLGHNFLQKAMSTCLEGFFSQWGPMGYSDVALSCSLGSRTQCNYRISACSNSYECLHLFCIIFYNHHCTQAFDSTAGLCWYLPTCHHPIYYM